MVGDFDDDRGLPPRRDLEYLSVAEWQSRISGYGRAKPDELHLAEIAEALRRRSDQAIAISQRAIDGGQFSDEDDMSSQLLSALRQAIGGFSARRGTRGISAFRLTSKGSGAEEAQVGADFCLVFRVVDPRLRVYAERYLLLQAKWARLGGLLPARDHKDLLEQCERMRPHIRDTGRYALYYASSIPMRSEPCSAIRLTNRAPTSASAPFSDLLAAVWAMKAGAAKARLQRLVERRGILCIEASAPAAPLGPNP
jgi:hypothetical protein